jgi:pilus assembly protein CpaB
MNRQRIVVAGAIVLGVLGMFIVIGYVRGVQARADAGGKMTTIYQAKDAISAGTPGSALAAHLKTAKMPARYAPVDAVKDLRTVKDLFVSTPVSPGATLTRATFASSPSTQGRLAIPSGHEAMAVELPMENGVESYAQPGDRVSVYATFPSSKKGPQTIKVASNVEVISTTTAATLKKGPATVTQTVYVLAVTPDEASRIVFGKQVGAIWLTLVPNQAKSPAVSPVTLDERRLTARSA